MKKFLLVVISCVGLVAPLRADPVIGFEDLPSNLTKTITNGYHLLSWKGFLGINASNPILVPSGFQFAAVSPVNVIYPQNASNASITAVMFDLLSVNATSISRDDLQLEAKGYIKGTLVYDQTNVLSATASQLIQYNFYGVDQVDFVSSGGTLHSGFINNGTFFAFDDVSVVTYLPYSGATNNGGFEANGYAGWTQTGNLSNATFVITSESSFVHSGSYAAKIGPALTLDTLGETIAPPTDIGRQYTVSFWLRNSAGGSNSFGAFWNGMPLMALTNVPSFSYTNYQFDVTAWGRSQFLQFQFQSAASIFSLDDVSVTPKAFPTNGGFETGDFSGWLHEGNTNNNHVSAADRRVGSFGADLGPSNAPATLSEPAVTQPGRPYLISAWLRNNNGNAPSNEFHVSWGGQSLLDLTNAPFPGWTNIHLTAMSSNTQSALQFGFRNDSDVFLFDEVTMYPMPIVANGGFEFGDFTGWTTSGNFTTSLVTTNKSFVNNGYYGGQFGPIGTPGYLSQTFATLPGQSYLLEFTLYVRFPLTNAEFTVSWNGTVLMDMTNTSQLGQVPYKLTVQATGTNATLQFGFQNDPAYFGLDDIFVSPIQAPAMQPTSRDANNLVNVSWSAMPGYLYDLQYKANLMQPNWISLQGPQLSTNSPMMGVDTNPPDPQRFYRVQLLPPP